MRAISFVVSAINVAFSALLLSGCGAEYQAKKEVGELTKHVEEARKEVRRAESELDSAYSSQNRAYAAYRAASAERNYNAIARSGEAGAAETLRYAKKMLDNPAYDAMVTSKQDEAKKDIERGDKRLEYSKQKLKEKEDYLSSLEAKLKAANNKLASIQSGASVSPPQHAAEPVTEQYLTDLESCIQTLQVRHKDHMAKGWNKISESETNPAEKLNRNDYRFTWAALGATKDQYEKMKASMTLETFSWHLNMNERGCPVDTIDRELSRLRSEMKKSAV